MPPCSRLWTTRASWSGSSYAPQTTVPRFPLASKPKWGPFVGGSVFHLAVPSAVSECFPGCAFTACNVQPPASRSARTAASSGTPPPRPTAAKRTPATTSAATTPPRSSSCRIRAESSELVVARCFGAFTRGFSAMPRANVAAAFVAPGLCKRRCPPARLPFVDPWSSSLSSLAFSSAPGRLSRRSSRPGRAEAAYGGRDRAGASARGSGGRARRGEVRVGRSARKRRSRRSRRRRSMCRARASSSSPTRGSPGTSARSRTRSNGWICSCRASNASVRRPTARSGSR